MSYQGWNKLVSTGQNPNHVYSNNKKGDFNKTLHGAP